MSNSRNAFNPLAHSVYHIARFTLEAETALSISTGASDGVFDTTLVRDANGLPALPGSSVAGVLRHLFALAYGQESMEKCFGFQEKTDGQASKVRVSWGVLQDSHGRAQEGIIFNRQDPLLNIALQGIQEPIFRDHVKLNHRGVAVDSSKFERSVLPAGFRFSLELSLWSKDKNDPEWQKLLQLLTHPAFRLGGKTRSGLGKMKVIALYSGSFDLKNNTDRQTFFSMKPAIDDPTSLTEKQINQNTTNILSIKLTLTPTDFWRFGQGSEALLQSDDPADLLPKIEKKVLWNNGQGRLSNPLLLLAGSSIKGALAHRLGFHYLRFSKQFVESFPNLQDYDANTDNPAVSYWFGSAKDKEKTSAKRESLGQAGRLLLDDLYLDLPDSPADRKKQLAIQMHTVIDRFRGGVREHMLFSEELAWRGKPWEITLQLLVDNQCNQAFRRALDATLQDLCAGRLSLGAGGAKGHGFCQGEYKYFYKNQELSSQDWFTLSDLPARTISNKNVTNEASV